MCEQTAMSRQPPTTQELSDAAGISKSYASEILNGKRESLGRPLAIHIYRKTGWKHPNIEALTEQQIALFEEVEPWAPPAAKAA